MKGPTSLLCCGSVIEIARLYGATTVRAVAVFRDASTGTQGIERRGIDDALRTRRTLGSAHKSSWIRRPISAFTV